MERQYEVGEHVTWHLVEGIPDPCDMYVKGYVSSIRDDGRVVVKTSGNNNPYDDLTLIMDESNERDFDIGHRSAAKAENGENDRQSYLSRENIRDLLSMGNSFTDSFPYLCKPGYYFKAPLPEGSLNDYKDAVVYYPTVFELGTLYYRDAHLDPVQRNEIVRNCVTVDNLLAICNNDERVTRQVHSLLKGESLLSSAFDKVYRQALIDVSTQDAAEGWNKTVGEIAEKSVRYDNTPIRHKRR